MQQQCLRELVNVKNVNVQITVTRFPGLLAMEKQEDLICNQVVEQYMRLGNKNIDLSAAIASHFGYTILSTTFVQYNMQQFCFLFNWRHIEAIFNRYNLMRA
jgi:hypothetical protein